MSRFVTICAGVRALALAGMLVGCTSAGTTPQSGTIVLPTGPTSTPSSAQPTSALTPAHIVVLGDSIAAGDDGRTDITDRWWGLTASAVQRARPDREVTVKNLALPGSGIVHLERTAAGVDVRDYQIAIIVEGHNDGALLDADWSPRYAAVIQALESRGLVVILGTYPPTFRDGAFEAFPRNTTIRAVAANKRPLLDFEARWLAAGPAAAAVWYTDSTHASAAGQIVEADTATTLLLTLMK